MRTNTGSRGIKPWCGSLILACRTMEAAYDMCVWSHYHQTGELPGS